jgi:large-conductance mechanosensitive channel
MIPFLIIGFFIYKIIKLISEDMEDDDHNSKPRNYKK